MERVTARVTAWAHRHPEVLGYFEAPGYASPPHTRVCVCVEASPGLALYVCRVISRVSASVASLTSWVTTPPLEVDATSV